MVGYIKKIKKLYIWCLVVGGIGAVSFSVVYYMYFRNIIICKQLVMEYLYDPDSVRFENIKYSKEGICGYYNARNRMGGYVGKKQFACDYNKNEIYVYRELKSYDDSLDRIEKDYQNRMLELYCP